MECRAHVAALLMIPLVQCCRGPGEPAPASAEAPRVGAREAEAVALPWTDEVPDVGRLDADMGGRLVEVNGTRLHVIEEGEGVPLVLLNGGPGDSLHAFVPHFSRAASFARVVYYDPRGVGRSDWTPGAGYGVRQALDDLEGLREALGIERWFVLGWSWGGHLARLYALRHPERVLGLALVSASAEFDERHRAPAPVLLTVEERKRIRACYTWEGRPALPNHVEGLPREHVARMVYNALRNGEWKRGHYYRPTDDEMARIARHERVHDAGYVLAMRRSSDLRLAGAFDENPFPTLVVDGRWDTTFPADKHRLLAREMGGSRAVLLEEASHHPFAEEPERFFALLEELVRGSTPPDEEAVARFRARTRPWVEKRFP